MVKPFAFTEAKIKALPIPRDGKDRAYHKDSKHPGLQVCVTSAGSKTYYYVRRVDGRPTRMKLGTVEQLSVDDARKAAAKKAGEIADGKNPQVDRRRKREEPTVKMLWDHWQVYAKAHKKPDSIYEDELKYNKFLKPLANRRLSTIRKADVQALHSRVGTENGIYQANRLLALIRAMFNKADELGYRGDNPARGIKLFKEQSRDRFLQPGELKAFFAALDAEDTTIRDFYVMLLLTGVRRSNLESMAWADVDLQAAYWRIPETKGGMPVVIPLVAPALTILMVRAETANGSPWVFPGRNGKHIANPKGAWTRICTVAGVSNLHPHDLRRSLGSWMAGQNTSLPIIGRALGHKTAVATMVYSRLSLDPIREAVDRATSAMLIAGGRTNLLTVESKGGDDGKTN
ncbi:MAG: tyrosine-type recombinase/integrase [Thermoguttaceae bacterium]